MLPRVLLVVDVGNTQTHFGAYDGDRLIEHWRFATVRRSTSDELGAALRNLLALRGHRSIRATIVTTANDGQGVQRRRTAVIRLRLPKAAKRPEAPR